MKKIYSFIIMALMLCVVFASCSSAVQQTHQTGRPPQENKRHIQRTT